MSINKPITEQDLLNRAKKGDQMAFKTLVEQHEQQVAATVIGMLGYCTEAEDIGQEVFIRFYKAMPNFRGDAKVSTYLSRIAINLSLNEIKRRKRKQWLSFFSNNNNEIQQIADKNTNEAQNDTQKMVQKALQMLDTKHRAVIVLRLIEGYSSQETADILERPIGTVLSQLARGQKKLKMIIEQL